MFQQNLTPLILDFFEPVNVIYDEAERQTGFGPTTTGQPNEIDSNGTDSD